MAKAIKAKNIEDPDPDSIKERKSAYIGVAFFILLPVQAFFKTELDDFLTPILNFNDGSQVVEVLVTNASLLVFTVLFIKDTVKQSRAEYEKLQESERKLQELNSELTIKVKERTIELELANEKRTHAFINLAHETKTPLTLMTDYLNVYLGKYDHLDNEELKLFKRQMNNLTRDINNFFDMEKIQKGLSLYNHNYVVDFSTALTDSIALFKANAAKKHITLSHNISEDIFIKADPGALRRIINNIVDNAIKYTSNNGSIHINLFINDNQVCFTVYDNGVGIPSELHERIFEPYYQINSEKSNSQGMGLGLPLVKKIIGELNGSIMLKSRVESEHGTEFIIKLPVYGKLEGNQIVEFTNSEEDFSNIDELTISEQPFDDTKATIMVIEDHVALLNGMVKHLQKRYNVHYAQNGEIAIEKLKCINKLDIIVSDLMMDCGNGYFLYQHILSSPKWNHIPFVFLTAKSTPSERMHGLNLGVIDYICKPISFEELEIKIEALLSNLAKSRNAIITQAYNSINNAVGIQKTSDPNINFFEQNCAKYKLTATEIAVMRLVIDGKIYKEIANTLSRSEETIKSHVRNSYGKIGVNNKLELAKKLGVTIEI